MGPAKIGPGRLVAVVGPSGSGKDSILRAAMALLAGDQQVVFPRRVITRAADRHEDHVPVSLDAFHAMAAAGAFALSWNAHGLRYGIPRDIDEAIGQGRTVVVNVSRAVVPLLRDRYANCTVVAVSVDPQHLAGRLAQRGRETPEDIRARVERAGHCELSGPDIVSLDNNGPLDEAVARFMSVIAPFSTAA